MKSCPFCGSDEFSSTLIVHEKLLGKGGNFPYCVCEKCGSMYLSQVPNDLSEYYNNSEYYSCNRNESLLRNFIVKYSFEQSGIIPSFLQFFMIVDQYSSNLQKVTKCKDVRLLDVGSGAGVNLNCIKGIGFENLLGVDPYIDKDIERPVRVLKTDLPNLDHTLKFEVIIFNHSLEHMNNPKQQLTEAKNRLSEEGVIIVSLPIVSKYTLDKFGENWVGIDAPRHLSIPSFAGFNILVEQVGLKLSRYDFYSGPGNFINSVRYRENKKIHSAGTRDLIDIFLNPAFYYYRHISKKLSKSDKGGAANFFLKE